MLKQQYVETKLAPPGVFSNWTSYFEEPSLSKFKWSDEKKSGIKLKAWKVAL